MKINFKVTTECPANCRCCQERLNNFANFSKASLDLGVLFNKILSLFQEAGDEANYLSITGGEPSLIPDLHRYVKKCTEQNIIVGIDTNGWNVTYEWLKEMELAGLKYILLSVYSLDFDRYCILRGVEDEILFNRLKRAIEQAREYKKSGGKIEIRIQTVLFKQNYSELPELLRMVIDSGFNTLSTAYYISNKADREIIMDSKDITDFKQRIVPELDEILKSVRVSKDIAIENKKRIGDFFEFEEVSMEQVANGVYRQGSCGDTNRIAIYPNGIVAPCLAFDYYMDEKYTVNAIKENLSYGDIRKKFLYFWEQEYNMCSNCSSGYQIWLCVSDK